MNTTCMDQDLEADLEATGFDDLDSLLNESVKQADARRAAKQAKRHGTKLDPLLAGIAEAAEAALHWRPEYSIARFVETHCQCGASQHRFDGWFVVSRHLRDASARRFVRSDSHNDLPAWQYVALEEAQYCPECLMHEGLPMATVDFILGVEALGQPCEACSGQLELPLSLDEAEGLLADLDLEDEPAYHQQVTVETVKADAATGKLDITWKLVGEENPFVEGSLNHSIWEATHQQEQA